MARFSRLAIILSFFLLIAAAALVSIFPLKVRGYFTQGRYLGVNLLENFVALYGRPAGDDLLANVRYYFRYEPDYNLKKSLSKIVELAGNTVVFNPNVWTPDKNSVHLTYDESQRQALIDSMRSAKRSGLKVILRPMVHILADESHSDWRGAINPLGADGNPAWDAWFKNYEKMSAFFLELALESGADVYVAGVELMTATRQIKQWNGLLSHLRERAAARGSSIKFAYDTLYIFEFNYFHDQIVSGNPDYAGFLGLLDHLGVNFYPVLLTTAQYEEPKKFLASNISAHADFINRAMHSMSDAVSNHTGTKRVIPAVIAEYGIRSAKGASRRPWEHPAPNDVIDYEEQSNALEIGIAELSRHDLIQGILVWNSYIDPYYGFENFPGREGKPNGENSFTITGKPAEKTVRDGFYRILGAVWMNNFNRFLFWTYTAAALAIAVFGLHRLSLVFRARRKRPLALMPLTAHPFVTIQVPVYNEPQVITGLLAALRKLDYPPDCHEIQILDDSSDQTSELIAEFIGKNPFACAVSVLKRGSREGFKAGALAAGLELAKGEFIAIFDADFRPSADFLKTLLSYFADNRVGLVQARWTFVNKTESMLTRVQGLYLTGHFFEDHLGRFHSKCCLNFNGTAGIFRKECILDAGGWQSDSLTEDLDLSYRAQMKNWEFVPAMHYAVPSELPEKILHFKKQQQRWVKGSMQVFKKLFFKIFAGALPLRVKAEAFFHLTGNALYFLVFLLALGLLTVINTRVTNDLTYSWFVDFPMLLGGTLVMFVFYHQAMRREKYPLGTTLLETLFGMIVGIGMCVNNSIALAEGILGVRSPFVRTPKKGSDTRYSEPRGRVLSRLLDTAPEAAIVVLEWMLCWYCYFALARSLEFDLFFSMAFSSLFFVGLFYVASLSTIEIVQKLFIPGGIQRR